MARFMLGHSLNWRSNCWTSDPPPQTTQLQVAAALAAHEFGDPHAGGFFFARQGSFRCMVKPDGIAVAAGFREQAARRPRVTVGCFARHLTTMLPSSCRANSWAMVLLWGAGKHREAPMSIGIGRWTLILVWSELPRFREMPDRPATRRPETGLPEAWFPACLFAGRGGQQDRYWLLPWFAFDVL